MRTLGEVMTAVDIFAATNTVPTTGAKKGKPFAHGRSWQYHSRSDRHSKTGCWAVLFDLLLNCPLMQSHAAAGKIGIGINHAVLNASAGKKKNLDFVIQRINVANPPKPRIKGAKDFAGLVSELNIVLSPQEQAMLAALPSVMLLSAPNAPVLMALEMKACMTEHIKSIARLFDELNSSHSLVHAASNGALAAGWIVINSSSKFKSPMRNNFPVGVMNESVSEHKPGVAATLAATMAAGLPLFSTTNMNGFDALGISIVSCANDGTPITVDSSTPLTAGFDYSTFLSNLAHLYSVRYAGI